MPSSRFTFYPPILTLPLMGPDPPTKLDVSLHDSGTVNYFQNYRNKTISRFSMPSYTWGLDRPPYSPKPNNSANNIRIWDRFLTMPSHDITTIDSKRMKEVDDLFKGIQKHRDQYKNDTTKFHPLVFFKVYDYKYQCAPQMTPSYVFKYPTFYVKYKIPETLPLTYKRRTRAPNIPELALSGVYSRSNCIAYKR